jgi:hypothetical protein
MKEQHALQIITTPTHRDGFNGWQLRSWSEVTCPCGWQLRSWSEVTCCVTCCATPARLPHKHVVVVDYMQDQRVTNDHVRVMLLQECVAS